MRQQYRVEKAIDQAIGRRILSSCWLLARLGVSIFQMLLLAQAWSLNQQAFVPACLASAWVLGAVVGMRLRADARLRGSCLVCCALLWLESTRLVSWQVTLLPIPLVCLCTLAVLALLLGMISTAWLAQRRLWSPAGERVTLARALVGTTAGLFVVWVLPAWARIIELTCVLPLLVFDVRFARRAPQPEDPGVVEAWVCRYWRPDFRPLRLSTASLPRNWWWSYLVERARESKGYVLLTLLASSAAVILGGVWGAVPTAFAGGMLQTHELDKLGWLLGGQIVALVIGVCWFRASRGMVGFPDRLLPPSWQSRARSFSLLTLVFAQRHVLPGRGMGQTDTLQLAHGRAQEERVTRLFITVECVLIAAFTPLVGWLIDFYGSFDRVLVIVGQCFLLGLTLLALISVVRSLKQPQRWQFARNAFGGRATHLWRPGYSHVRPGLAW